MTECEMLELAAKAAGYKVRITQYENVDIDNGAFWVRWNPRDDDGDSRRLQVRLRISVDFNVVDEIDNVITLSWRDKWQNLISLSHLIDDSAEASLRLAIFRAAVDIGKYMPLQVKI